MRQNVDDLITLQSNALLQGRFQSVTREKEAKRPSEAALAEAIFMAFEETRAARCAVLPPFART